MTNTTDVDPGSAATHCSLPRELVVRLREYLMDVQDEGPFGEGWKSDELIADINILGEAIGLPDGTSRILTCVYCGHEYPQDTPASGDEHAMLRKALIGLVGAESYEELEQIEAAIRVMPVPDIDRLHTINAIQALLQTSSG